MRSVVNTVFPPKMSTIGPQLPAHLQKQKEGESSSDDESYGPRLPSTACRGPPPPPAQRDQESNSDTDDSDDYGPSLPPGLKNAKSSGESESDDEDMVGPSIAEKTGVRSSHEIAEEFEARSKRMKDKLEGKDMQEVKRDSWMLELPEEKANRFGLMPTARQFSRKGVEERGKDRSVWTDNPQEKQSKMEAGGTEKMENNHSDKVHLMRDREMEKVASELREKRGSSSLMNLHEEKLKKKKKEKGEESNERRPFDRDTDLQANRFDDAAKKAMLKKAAKIDDRFSSGNQKFL